MKPMIFFNSVESFSIIVNNDEQTKNVVNFFRSHDISICHWLSYGIANDVDYGYPCSLGFNVDRVSWCSHSIDIPYEELKHVYLIS